MKSNVCKIEKGTKDLAAILKESEKVAVYNDFTHKQTLHLRLICEELDGMLPELVGNFEGYFWIEVENGVCYVKASIELGSISSQKREQLISVTKNKKNAAAVGVVGKIRSALESFFLDYDQVDSSFIVPEMMDLRTTYDTAWEYSYYWSLEDYKHSVKSTDKKEAWDELEKSVIASVADDIVIGIKGSKADITIVKNIA